MQIRRILSLFCALALLVCVFSACGKNPAPIVSDALLEAQSDERLESRQLKIVTYNTAAPWGNVLKGTSSGKRAPLFAEQMANLAPDILFKVQIQPFAKRYLLDFRNPRHRIPF